MSILLLSLGLFIVGLIEYVIDQYQKIVLSRLRFWSTINFQLVNKLLEFAINIYVFGTVIAFWEKFRDGNHDFKLLLPYLLYVLGTVCGTGIAMIIYTRIKKAKDHEHTLKLISRTDKKGKKRSKKKYNKMVDDAVTKMSTETLLDPIETEDLKDQIKAKVVENISQSISEKVDKALDQEKE
jgi:DNA integrity scanning protein DisA with diadenylate cyclase activity